MSGASLSQPLLRRSLNCPPPQEPREGSESRSTACGTGRPVQYAGHRLSQLYNGQDASKAAKTDFPTDPRQGDRGHHGPMALSESDGGPYSRSQVPRV
jgi:hypothetical protein